MQYEAESEHLSLLMGTFYGGVTLESYCLKLDKTSIPSDILGRVFSVAAPGAFQRIFLCLTTE